MGKVWTVANGDYNHVVSVVDWDRDVQPHDSLAAAVRAFRAEYNDWEEMHDETYTWNVYFYDPNGEDVHGEPYPDRRFSIGKRGGIRVDTC